MRAISRVCLKLNYLITWSKKRGIHLYFHCPKHIHSWHLMPQVQHSSHLLLWSDPCIAESNFIEGMPSPQTRGGDGLCHGSAPLQAWALQKPEGKKSCSKSWSWDGCAGGKWGKDCGLWKTVHFPFPYLAVNYPTDPPPSCWWSCSVVLCESVSRINHLGAVLSVRYLA